jgi:hypothetical protein
MRVGTELRIIRFCQDFKELVADRELDVAIRNMLEDREQIFCLLTELDIVSELVLDEEKE